MMTLDDSVGEAAYAHHRLIETMYRGPNGEQFTTGVAMPISLTVQRLPSSCERYGRCRVITISSASRRMP